MKLSIIIPIFNEEAILKASVTGLIRQLNNLKISNWEVLLVENGSTDATQRLAVELTKKHPQLVLLTLPKSGYGKALKHGLLKARGKILVIFNIDFWDVEFLQRGLELIKTNDIVNASKTLISAQDKRPVLRRQLTYWFNILLRVIYNFPGTDTHGLKVLRADTVLPLVKHCYPLDELFDTQLMLRACKKGLVYTELPITVKEVRPSRYFNMLRFVRLMHDLLIIFKYRYL